MKGLKHWLPAVAIALATTVGLGIASPQSGMALETSKQVNQEKQVESKQSEQSRQYKQYALTKVAYPEMAQYPDEEKFIDEKTGEFDSDGFEKVFEPWSAEQRERRNIQEPDIQNLDSFFSKSIQQFLSGAGTDNRVCSPVNVYMALSMLAELTDGNSRQQILSLLGAKNIDALRTQAKAIWAANYCADGATTSVLANSLWLNQDVNFTKKTLDSLAKNYYASSFRGKMGSDNFNKALQDWLNEQTGGLLSEQAGNLEMDADTILALATTVYFRAKWASEFAKESTSKQVFYTADQKQQTCDFMHQSESGNYYWGKHFSAVSKSLDSGSGSMYFLLPDKDSSPEELLKDSEAMQFLLSRNRDETWKNSKHLTIKLSMPKFDASSDLDLIEGLKKLGIQDVFDSDKSNFSPMTRDIDEVYLGQAKHAARVSVDEQGCTAAAYTVMMMCGGGMPPADTVDFTLDRPFLFVLNGQDGLPLFVGVINQP